MDEDIKIPDGTVDFVKGDHPEFIPPADALVSYEETTEQE